MPDNFIVFTLQGVDWPLSRVCFAVAGAFFVVGAILFTCALVRYGKVRALSESEAASVAMHAGEVGSVDRAVTRHGAARGSEVQVSISIGDLREAYHARDWFRFFALHTAILLLWNSAGILMFGYFLLVPHPVVLFLVVITSVPITIMIPFCWWAAIYTKLQ